MRAKVAPKVKTMRVTRADPPGWRGNVYYPSGTAGSGFGIEVLPTGKVWFPRVETGNSEEQNTPPETPKIEVQTALKV